MQTQGVLSENLPSQGESGWAEFLDGKGLLACGVDAADKGQIMPDLIRLGSLLDTFAGWVNR